MAGMWLEMEPMVERVFLMEKGKYSFCRAFSHRCGLVHLLAMKLRFGDFPVVPAASHFTPLTVSLPDSGGVGGGSLSSLLYPFSPPFHGFSYPMADVHPQPGRNGSYGSPPGNLRCQSIRLLYLVLYIRADLAVVALGFVFTGLNEGR